MTHISSEMQAARGRCTSRRVSLPFMPFAWMVVEEEKIPVASVAWPEED